MNDYIDIYCERTAPGLWAEPLNALTNIAFFIALFFAWRLARRESVLDVPNGLLLFLLFAIGTGSTLFHTFALRWAMLADTLPILLFQIAFIGTYARRVMRLSFGGVAGLLTLFFALVYGFATLPGDWLNGSLSYAPAFLFLLGLGFYHMRSAVQARMSLLFAAGAFVISLTLRSIDMDVCAALPIGLHFMWHVLNAVVLYLSLRALFLNSRI